MIEEVIFSDKIGQGLILRDGDKPDWKNTTLIVGCCTLVSGEKTTMEGFFRKPITFEGVRGKDELVFHIGKTEDIFGETNYYETIHRISDIRLFKMYT